jgi:hypothetical protein
LDARVVKAPKVLMGDYTAVPNNDVIRLNSLEEQKNLYTEQSKAQVDRVVKGLSESAKRFKIRVKAPAFAYQIKTNQKAVEIYEEIQDKVQGADILLVVVSRKDAGCLYKDVKRLMNKKGRLTQFVVTSDREHEKGLMTKLSGILIQMQAKMGKNPWLLDVGVPGALVMGADVFHAPKNNSVSALVSRFGERMGRTYSTSQVHRRRYEEVIGSLSRMVLEHVEHFEKKSKKLPRCIVLFRDGVSEGFVDRILHEEVASVKNELQLRFGLQKPKLTVVLVTKRIDDRFAVRIKGVVKNPEGGIVVVDDVVKKGRPNFYMVS